LAKYARKKRVEELNEIKENVHFISMFRSEKVYSLKDMKDYQLTKDESDELISIKNERKSIEKEINYLRRKVDRFRTWKEKFNNLKEVIDTLELNNTQYAIQLKENNYQLWKFKKKWKVIAVVNSKYNIMKSRRRWDRTLMASVGFNLPGRSDTLLFVN
jgi:hypothetical protein